jgi:hypothetical protein
MFHAPSISHQDIRDLRSDLGNFADLKTKVALSACARKSLRSVSALLSALVLRIVVKTLRNDLRFPALVTVAVAEDWWLV